MVNLYNLELMRHERNEKKRMHEYNRRYDIIILKNNQYEIIKNKLKVRANLK